ncbi:hypothetical protein [Galbibacter sp.]
MIRLRDSNPTSLYFSRDKIQLGDESFTLKKQYVVTLPKSVDT